MNITRIELRSEAQPHNTITLERDGKSVLIGWRDDDGVEGPIDLYEIEEDHDRKFSIAQTLAAEIYGRNKHGSPQATNSMIHDCWQLIQQVAGE